MSEIQNIIFATGYIGIISVIFAESGLFFGFFLPGDSLLFMAGILASQGYFNIWILAFFCFISAVAGDSVGYWFGRKTGPKIFNKDDSFFFSKKNIERTRNFYEKYGRKTIILARFVPIVRTFAPIFAGVAGMKYSVFFSYNVIGGLVWTWGLLFSSYFLGGMFPQTEKYLSLIIVAILILSVLPIAYEVLKEWFSKKRKEKQF